jgi:3-dehydroquinate dehydratase type I
VPMATPKICVPIVAGNNREALKKIVRAAVLADVLELRLDLMASFSIPELVRASSRPVIVTYRSEREGGRGTADVETRIRYLQEAVEAGAAFVDLEFRLLDSRRKKILENRGRSKVILSAHFVRGTPPFTTLKERLKKMASHGAEVVKIVTLAQTPADNLRTLSLIPEARKMGVELITFCMGSLGQLSRIATVLLGGYLTFAALETGEASAPGQIPVRELKQVLAQII